jgi:hypothetical protein
MNQKQGQTTFSSAGNGVVSEKRGPSLFSGRS